MHMYVWFMLKYSKIKLSRKKEIMYVYKQPELTFCLQGENT